ncbi:ABC-type dipeptide/oligopeptide/nickel transport system permease subunit [Bradyrhizobium sp. LB1.3]|jgi:ABC-type dipeptide/oligopeptide/nickel transport system permease subunit
MHASSLRHILPDIVSPLIVSTTLAVSAIGD